MSSEKHETSMLVLFFHSGSVSFPLTISQHAHITRVTRPIVCWLRQSM